MNARIIAIALLFAAMQNTASGRDDQTALPAVNVKARTDVPLVVNCGDEQLPDREAIGQVLGTNNAGAIDSGREVVAHYAHRECLRGAAHVAFERDTSAKKPALKMVEGAASP